MLNISRVQEENALTSEIFFKDSIQKLCRFCLETHHVLTIISQEIITTFKKITSIDVCTFKLFIQLIDKTFSGD